MQRKNTQKIGGALLVIAMIIVILTNTITIKIELYLIFTYRVLGFIGFILLIPWQSMPNIIFDNKEYSPNTKKRQLIKKIRSRALLLKNLSTIILLLSIVTITLGFFLLINPYDELLNVLSIGNDTDTLKYVKDIVWNKISIRLSVVFLLIFLIQVLFRVFRYLLRVSAYYDGIADSLEIHLMDKNTDLVKILELLTPNEYDISELKQSSFSDSLLNLLKNK